MRLLFSYSHLKMKTKKTKKPKHFLACGLYRTLQQAGFGLWAFVYPTLPKYLKRLLWLLCQEQTKVRITGRLVRKT